MKNVSPCGFLCPECPFKGSCQGCLEIRGRAFWVEKAGYEVCPIYDCAVNSNGIAHCGQCPQLPCPMFLNLKDPNISEEAFQQDLKARIDRLRRS